MYILVSGKKVFVKECVSFKDRFKSFKFYLGKIDYGIKISKKRIANTYLFCQKVDICLTDRDNKIIGLFFDVKSERLIFKKDAYNVYYLPLGCAKKLKLGDVLKERD